MKGQAWRAVAWHSQPAAQSDPNQAGKLEKELSDAIHHSGSSLLSALTTVDSCSWGAMEVEVSSPMVVALYENRTSLEEEAALQWPG
jgi:hypothetical protein